jgi:hypothetical protein
MNVSAMGVVPFFRFKFMINHSFRIGLRSCNSILQKVAGELIIPLISHPLCTKISHYLFHTNLTLWNQIPPNSPFSNLIIPS